MYSLNCFSCFIHILNCKKSILWILFLFILGREDRGLMMCQNVECILTSKTGNYTKQQDVMDVLELDDSDKSMLTRCVKKCFPESTKKITIDKES